MKQVEINHAQKTFWELNYYLGSIWSLPDGNTYVWLLLPEEEEKVPQEGDSLLTINCTHYPSYHRPYKLYIRTWSKLINNTPHRGKDIYLVVDHYTYEKF